MNEEQKLDQATASEGYWHRRTPPNSRDPEVLADAIERRLEGWGNVSFVELADWLGESFRGNGRLTDAHDPNIVFWDNLRPEIGEALDILMQAGRVEFRATIPLIYMMDGGILPLPIVKRPPAAGYVNPHWQPVALIVPPGKRPCQ